VAMVWLGLNERNVQAYRIAAERHGGVVLDLGRHAQPSSGQYGHMVRVAGTPVIVQRPRDPQFNVTADAIRLTRVVEMFQWHEVHMGHSVFYEQDWEDHPIDSSRFVHPQGHRNHVRFPFTSEQFVAPNVRLGGFRLAPQMIASINGDQPVTPDMASLPPNLAASFQLYHGALVTSADPGSPRLGDIRVRWRAVPPQSITVIARAEGAYLKPAVGVADGAGYEVQIGDRSLADVLPDLPPRPKHPWAMRIMALLLAWAGVILFGQRHRRMPVAWLTTLAVALALTTALGAALWIAVDLWTGLWWAGVMALALVVVFWLSRGRAV
jgi:hypothetical protein